MKLCKYSHVCLPIWDHSIHQYCFHHGAIALQIPISMLTDSLPLLDVITNSPITPEKRLMINIEEVKIHINETNCRILASSAPSIILLTPSQRSSDARFYIKYWHIQYCIIRSNSVWTSCEAPEGAHFILKRGVTTLWPLLIPWSFKLCHLSIVGDTTSRNQFSYLRLEGPPNGSSFCKWADA